MVPVFLATNNKIQVSVKGSIVAIIFTTYENVYVKAVATVELWQF